MLSEFSEYEIMVSFRNFLGLEGRESFKIWTESYKGISLKLHQIGALRLKSYEHHQVEVDAIYLECDLDGTLATTPEEVTLII